LETAIKQVKSDALGMINVLLVAAALCDGISTTAG
jgi:hypothetical protein